MIRNTDSQGERSAVSRTLLAAMTHARNRYRQMPLPLRRSLDSALGRGIYKKPMRRRGALFIHVPKAAGTAISQALFGLSAVGHYTAQEAREYDTELYDSLFTFAFVRDPVTRAVSAYNFLRTSGTAEVPVAFPKRYSHIADQTFDEFVEWLGTVDVDRSNPVLHRQTKYVCDAGGSMMVDYLGRFESIQEDFAEVSRRLDMDTRLTHRNASASECDGASIDAGTRARLRDIYRSDFELLGYA